MNDDFQQRYLSAEQAYGCGDYRRAEAVTTQLLQELETMPTDGETEAARFAWRAFVALLLGHIHFHGLKDSITASRHYRLVLESQPTETLRELAEQGLEACDHPASEQVESAGSDLIRDPFRSDQPVLATPRSTVSATPWLEGEPTVETPPEPEPEPVPELVPEARMDPASSVNLVVDAVPIVDPESTPEPDPPAPEPPEPEPRRVDPSVILKGALLRLDLRDR